MGVMDQATNPIDRAAVFKQRRLLLLFTFALTAIHGLGVELGNTVSSQGLVLTFKPITIIWVLWICWAWAFWRYWQYERAFADQALTNHRYSLWGKHATAAILQHFSEKNRSGEFKDNGLAPEDNISIVVNNSGAFRPENGFEDNLWEFPNLKLTAPKYHKNQQTTYASIEVNYTFDFDDVKRIKAAVERELFVRHTSFADFKVPYLLVWFAPMAFAASFAWSWYHNGTLPFSNPQITEILGDAPWCTVGASEHVLYCRYYSELQCRKIGLVDYSETFCVTSPKIR